MIAWTLVNQIVNDFFVAFSMYLLYLFDLCIYRNLSGNMIHGAIPSSLGTIASLEKL